MKNLLVVVLVICLVLAGCERGEAVPSSGGGPVASGAFSEPEKEDSSESSSAASGPEAGDTGTSEEVSGPSQPPSPDLTEGAEEELLAIATDFAVDYPKPFSSTKELIFERFVMLNIYYDDPALMDDNSIVWIDPTKLAEEVEVRFGISAYRFISPERENEYPRYVEEKDAIAFYTEGEYSAFLAEFIDLRQEGLDFFYTFDIYNDFITDGHEEAALERRLCYHFRLVERADGRPWLQAVSAVENDDTGGDLSIDCERYIGELGFLLNSADWETAEVVSPAMYAMWYGYRVNDLPSRDHYLIDGRDGMFFPAEEFEQAILDRFAVSVEHLRSDPVIYLEKEQLYQTPMALMPLAESQIQVLDTEQDGTVIRIGFSQYFVDSKNMVEKELTLEVEEGTEEFRFLGYVDR